jgi:hypothetical protein
MGELPDLIKLLCNDGAGLSMMGLEGVCKSSKSLLPFNRDALPWIGSTALDGLRVFRFQYTGQKEKPG